MLRQDRPAGLQPEEIAVLAFGWLAGDTERLDAFLSLTGLTPATIRDASRAPGFLVAVAEHVVRDEALLVAFARERNLPPAVVGAALCRLAGMEHG